MRRFHKPVCEKHPVVFIKRIDYQGWVSCHHNLRWPFISAPCTRGRNQRKSSLLGP